MNSEIQNYIDQSRAAGMSDEQIRQALAGRGWGQTDIDKAFGMPSAAGPTGSSNKTVKIIITVLILLFLIPLLFWGIIVGFNYYKLKNLVFNPGPISTPTPADSVKKPLDCDNPQFDSLGLGELLPSLPATWPSDVPVYPSSKLLGSNSLVFGGQSAQFSTAVYCSKDNVEKIADFFVNSNLGWKFTREFSGTSSNTDINVRSITVVGKKDGPDGVIISISNAGSGADTLIYEQFAGGASN